MTKGSKFTKKVFQISDLDTATVVGGCFWCVEAPFEKIHGIVEVVSGYAGGHKENPTYEEVSSGKTDYAEAVQIIYDPQAISYWQILDIFWKNIDPTDPGGSFYDRGSQYRSVIFYHNDLQRELAERSRAVIESMGIFEKPVVTKIEKYTGFYPAEEYHQDFYRKDPDRYYSYRQGSGRDVFFEKHWSNLEARLQKFRLPENALLEKMLTPLQFEVTQREGTERAFHNLFWDDDREGIYVDLLSGEPLFSSADKFKSGSGWPSFTRPLDTHYIVEQMDRSMGMERIEVRSRIANSHLGHVFNDGPPPAGLRYCINSAALRFIPKADMKKYGYGKYLHLFESNN
ncbi:MAG: peptide-methionine (R)-S-oxide reductase MsrB [Calditrichia bacterium]